MDIVIPYRLMNEGVELRFVLRSIEAYLTGITGVFLIGDKPAWLSDKIHYIYYRDSNNMRHRERNIYDKVMVAVREYQVSDDFLFMNDDHFIRQPWQADQWPTYAFGLIKDVKTTNQPYISTLANTMEITGGEAPYLDGHCPIIYNKYLFKKAFKDIHWDKDWGYCIKTIYGFHVKPPLDTAMKDIKLNGIDGMKFLVGPCFSTTDRAFTRQMVQAMENLYPKKSRYELY